MEDILIQALKAAGEVHMKRFRTSLQITQKENISSVVTETDVESEKIIMETIASRFPGHNILSEECGFVNRHSEFTWVIDPLDGTSNYAAGLPWFGILIAVLKNSLPMMAGAYLPASGDLYFAEKGKGASCNGDPLKIEETAVKDKLAAFSIDYTTDEGYLKNGIRYYQYLVQHTRNVRSTNCLLDYLYVAEGRFGGCINLFSRVWDIAAPWLIVTEAGGVMKSLDFTEIDFRIDDHDIHKNYPVVAGSKTFVKDLCSFTPGAE